MHRKHTETHAIIFAELLSPSAETAPRIGFGRIVALFLLGLSPIVAWIVAWIVTFARLCDMKVKTLPII